jgi:hypothetical protein
VRAFSRVYTRQNQYRLSIESNLICQLSINRCDRICSFRLSNRRTSIRTSVAQFRGNDGIRRISLILGLAISALLCVCADPPAEPFRTLLLSHGSGSERAAYSRSECHDTKGSKSDCPERIASLRGACALVSLVMTSGQTGPPGRSPRWGRRQQRRERGAVKKVHDAHAGPCPQVTHHRVSQRTPPFHG